MLVNFNTKMAFTATYISRGEVCGAGNLRGSSHRHSRDAHIANAHVYVNVALSSGLIIHVQNKGNLLKKKKTN